MALTIGTEVSRELVGRNRQVIVDITGDSSYAVGGEGLVPSDVRLNQFFSVELAPKNGNTRTAVYDYANEKVEVFESVAALTQTFAFGGFTDGGSTSGHVDFSNTIPAGAVILGWKAVTATGFTGDTSAVIQVGVSGDVDRFSAQTTGSVFAAGTVGSLSLAADAADAINAAVTPRVTVTSGSDFGSVSAGSTTVSVFYTVPPGLTECAAGTDLSAAVWRARIVGR